MSIKQTEWLTSEDEAMRAKLLNVPVNNEGAVAEVWFRYPQFEQREVKYPFITIDLVDISKADEREHRGWIQVSSTPQPATPQLATPPADPAQAYMTEWPIPYNIDYQVTTYARLINHDRRMQIELHKANRLPDRFGFLVVYDPLHGPTSRRLDMLGWQTSDLIEGDKRVFRKIYNVRVSSQLFMYQLIAISKVLSIELTITDTVNG